MANCRKYENKNKNGPIKIGIQFENYAYSLLLNDQAVVHEGKKILYWELKGAPGAACMGSTLGDDERKKDSLTQISDNVSGNSALAR